MNNITGVSLGERELKNAFRESNACLGVAISSVNCSKILL